MTPAPASTRERILDAAFQLFVEVGFAGTTVTEIELRAGLTPGSGGFYRHFRSKEALLPVAVEREAARCLASLAPSSTPAPVDGDPVVARRIWLHEILKGIESFDPLIRLMLADGYRVPEVRLAITTALAHLSEQLSVDQSPELTVCLLALGGYHLFSEVQGEAYQGVSVEELIDVLASLTTPTPP